MRSKSIHFKNSNQESFIKEFARLYTRVAPWQAWSDFVTLSAISIANPFDKTGTIHNNREQEYLNIIKKYKEEEQQIFPKLFALLVDALEEYPEQDFLGEIFMALGLGSHWKGQFFTPYDVCKLMAIVSTADMRKDVQKCGWVSVCDMCCGAGAL